jgi:hypothetical protein
MGKKFNNKEKTRQSEERGLYNKNIFDYVCEKIVPYKDTAFYKFIYKHPILSITILIIWGVVIILMFFLFIYTLFNLSK